MPTISYHYFRLHAQKEVSIQETIKLRMTVPDRVCNC
jgi:hypothetical protein